MQAFICDAQRTPIGRYGGALSSVRADDLASVPISALMARNSSVDWSRVDDVILGCANQAGEDNRNVARMAALLAGLPIDVPGSTINRLCASGMDAVGAAARAIRAGDIDLAIAGGAELIDEEEVDRVPVLLQQLIADRDKRQLMASIAVGMGMPDAAQTVAQALIEAAT